MSEDQPLKPAELVLGYGSYRGHLNGRILGLLASLSAIEGVRERLPVPLKGEIPPEVEARGHQLVYEMMRADAGQLTEADIARIQAAEAKRRRRADRHK